MRSLTSVCAPNPTARPRIPALVRIGRDVHPQLVEHHQRGDDDDDGGQRFLDKVAERASALQPLDHVGRFLPGELVLEAARRGGDDPDHHVGEDRDDGDPEARSEEPFAESRRGGADAGTDAEQVERRKEQRRGRCHEDGGSNDANRAANARTDGGAGMLAMNDGHERGAREAPGYFGDDVRDRRNHGNRRGDIHPCVVHHTPTDCRALYHDLLISPRLRPRQSARASAVLIPEP